jgi:hypothetical protein
MSCWDPEALAISSDQINFTEGVNRLAKPKVGEAFMVGTIGDAPRDSKSGMGKIKDYYSDKKVELDWGFHFVGVVAQSGTDRITLENYASPDKCGGLSDPRWFFQMYSEKYSQSFHFVSASSGSFANPLTLAVRG